MSEIRLVRCPKCNKVLPEPANVTVYQCGACGALLSSGKSKLGGELSEGSEKLVSSDKGGEGIIEMGSISPVRSKFGNGIGNTSPIEESHLNEPNGYLRKSSMEDGLFSDSPSVLDSSIRPANTSGSPMRDFKCVNKSPAISTNVDSPNSPMRGDASKFDENVIGEREVNMEQEAMGREVSSFTTMLPDDKPTGKSILNYHGRQRTWRDRHGKGLKNGSFSGYGKSRGSMDRWVGESHEVAELGVSFQDLALERAELLPDYNNLKDQLSGFDYKTNSSPGSHRGADEYLEVESSRFRQGSLCNYRPPHYDRSLDFDYSSHRSYNGHIRNSLDSRRTLLSTHKKRVCHPIAGGSPFVLCCKCFRLLKLSAKFMQKNYDQFQCGACATIISFDLQTWSFGLFLSQQKLSSVSSATSTNVGSYDFDAKSSVISKGQRLSSSSAVNLRNSRFSKENCYSDLASVQNTLLNLVHPPPGSTLEDHLEYSDVFRKLQEAASTKSNYGEEKHTIQKDSLDNAVIASKARSSVAAGLVKWGFASESGRSSRAKPKVYVNGQPISPPIVKKAEKLSGPIEPGNYWYDSKAGFWGVMGHRCLGIIPPSIQEFNFPMTANCCGGDTRIYVNGRELHKRDTELLKSRGLPKTSNMRYIIDISGKVVDEETREFVVNLGKLAPSVERNRCGYGMHVSDKLQD